MAHEEKLFQKSGNVFIAGARRALRLLKAKGAKPMRSLDSFKKCQARYKVAVRVIWKVEIAVCLVKAGLRIVGCI